MKRKGLLLDRDGVINEDHGYVYAFDQFDFIEGLFPFLNSMQDKGYRIAVVTNQSGVARSYYTEQDYEKLTSQMLAVFKEKGISIDLTLACFTHPEGEIEELGRESFWRKPHPGMILEAAQKLNLDLSRSVMIGDKDTDMKAALAAGVSRGYWLGGKDSPWPEVTTVTGYDQIMELEKSKV